MAATSAFAQSNVTISGTFDASLNNAKTTYQTGVSVSQTGLSHSNRGTSGVIFRGVEELGGGLKANFWYELNFNPNNSGSLNGAASNEVLNSLAYSGNASNDSQTQNGQVFGGLEGAFGALRIGAPNSPSLTTQTSRHFFGTKVGGGFGSVTGTGHIRNDSTILYATPNFAGLTLAMAYSTKTKLDANRKTSGSTVLNTYPVADATDIALNYANGPVRAGVSYWQTNSTVEYENSELETTVRATVKNKQTNAYVQYDIGALTLAGGLHRETTAGVGTATRALDATGANIAAKYAVTPELSLLGNFAKLNSKLTSDLDQRIAAIGLDYSLSKRTTVYARTVSAKVDNVTTATSSKNVKTTLVGLQHNF